MVNSLSNELRLVRRELNVTKQHQRRTLRRFDEQLTRVLTTQLNVQQNTTDAVLQQLKVIFERQSPNRIDVQLVGDRRTRDTAAPVGSATGEDG